MNRLARETSPYLLQHGGNPVDWYPWGPEALERARVEHKPILLSIGYSACHWCHVMEHESFENEAIARLMNEHFVNIKVDREERPDLDQIYQGVAQAMTRSGGWPLTVFLTPELKPFFGGTYFPPEDRYGRPGFPRLLVALSQAFRQDPAAIAENAEKLLDYIRESRSSAPQEAVAPSRAFFEGCARKIVSFMDPDNGGMGDAPKFPNAMLADFLIRFSFAEGAEPMGHAARTAVRTQLTRMARGGIFDQLGGGFHRYSVDATWSVPHFEKMLYDNGLLLKTYSEALCLFEDLEPEETALYLETVKMTVGYLLREMRSAEGAFWAAQDADSEGEEGRFFVWSPAQLDELATQGALSAEEVAVFRARFGVSAQGNFEHHGTTVLHQAHTTAQVALLLGREEPWVRERLASCCVRLLEVRGRRIPPATDHKVLASWNGLAISGLSWAALALERHGETDEAQRARQAATAAFACVREKMGRPGARLFSTLQQGQPKLNAYLDDYAFMAQGALDLARGAQETELPGLLAEARRWTDVILAHFGDPASRTEGYFFTSDDHEALIHRPRSAFDQAIPAGTAVAISVMLGLGELLEDGARYADEAREQLAGLSPWLERAPQGLGELLCAAMLAWQEPITVSGEGTSGVCLHPHIFRKPGAPAPMVCHHRVCGLPLADAGEAWKQASEKCRL